MGGYTKQFSSVSGDKIDAELFDSEYQLVQDGFVSHKHDGSTPEDGDIVPLIADADFLNSVETNSVDNQIEINTEVGGVKTLQLTVKDGVILPSADNYIDLGSDTNQFKDLYIAGKLTLTDLTLGGYTVVNILDEDDMVTDADDVLVTQQSVKAFVETSVAEHPGLFLQSNSDTRTADFALSGGMADYLSVPITVKDVNSVVHINAFIGARGEDFSGTVFASIWRDGTLLTPEEFTVTNSENDTSFTGSTGWVGTDAGPFIDNTTYVYTIKLREQLTNGVATHANLVILEENGA